MKAIFKWGAAAAVCAGGAYWWFSGDAAAEQQMMLSTTHAVRGDFVNKVQATGTLEPQELVDVGAQVTGEIKEFGTDVNGKRVDYGSEVKAGQLLARIDDTIVELDIQRAEASVAQANAQIAQAKANIAQSQANKNKADRDLERAKRLGVGDALSQMAYDQYVTSAETAAANFEQAQAQLQASEAQLLSAQAQLASQLRNRDYTHIKSPVDGTIVVRQVNVGQTVVSSMNASTLFLVARDLSKMQIWASVNEADIAKVTPGQEVRYTVDARPNETFTGTVNKIRPNATMSSNVVTYIVEIDIENPDRKLLPYMSANANFIVKEYKDVLMVADSAFSFRPDPAMIDPAAPKPEAAPEEGAAPAGDGTPAVLWVKSDKMQKPETAEENGYRVPACSAKDIVLRPVRVLKGEGDGTRSIITLAEGETLKPGDEIVTGVRQLKDSTAAAAAGAAGEKTNPFGPKMPQRRQPSTGGAPARPGQDTKHMGGPPHGFILLPFFTK